MSNFLLFKTFAPSVQFSPIKKFPRTTRFAAGRWICFGNFFAMHTVFSSQKILPTTTAPRTPTSVQPTPHNPHPLFAQANNEPLPPSTQPRTPIQSSSLKDHRRDRHRTPSSSDSDPTPTAQRINVQPTPNIQPTIHRIKVQPTPITRTPIRVRL